MYSLDTLSLNKVELATTISQNQTNTLEFSQPECLNKVQFNALMLLYKKQLQTAVKEKNESSLYASITLKYPLIFLDKT